MLATLIGVVVVSNSGQLSDVWVTILQYYISQVPTMFRCIVLLALSSVTYGLEIGGPSSDGTLQCQCTCTPVGIPNQKIFTSGNMNVIEETSAPVNNTVVEQSIPKEKQITPTVEATNVPINKEITEFQDVAVSKVRNSLGLGVNEQTIVEDVDQETKKVIAPKIKWMHSASSNDVVQSKAQQKPPQSSINKTNDVPARGLGETSSLMMNKETTVNERVVEQPPQLNEHVSTLSGVQQNVIKGSAKSGMMGQQSVMSESQTEVMTDQPRVNNVQSSVHVDETKPTNGGLQQVQVIHDRPMEVFGSSNRNSDKVAADIGFVLDGSAPNPIISGVMSGIGRTSMGTGYIVENIKSDKPAHLGKGYFVNKIVNSQAVSGISNSSRSQPTHSVDSVKSPMEQTTVSVVKSNYEGNVEKQTNNFNNQATTNNNKPTQNMNKAIPNNNVKQIQNNRRVWNNNGNQLDTKNQSTNRNNQLNNNKWQNNNQRNNGRNNNRSTWKKEQMKPFQIQRDQKQTNGWNNNNRWGNNNWGTTTNPSVAISNMPFGMIGIDPLMFLGQHHFK